MTELLVPKEKLDVVSPNAGWVVMLLSPKDARGPLPPTDACVLLLPKAGWAIEPAKLKQALKQCLVAGCWASGAPASGINWLAPALYDGGGFKGAPTAWNCFTTPSRRGFLSENSLTLQVSSGGKAT